MIGWSAPNASRKDHHSQQHIDLQKRLTVSSVDLFCFYGLVAWLVLAVEFQSIRRIRVGAATINMLIADFVAMLNNVH